MTQNKTHVPVEIDLSQIEFDTIEVAATACDQTVEQFLQPHPKRVVTVPRDAVRGFPFFLPAGMGAVL